jgi:peptidoglycan/xylan/chitin deacetylase (PgdA/CDA1 family)
MRAILTYHSIDDSGSPISVDRAAFQAHLEWFDRGEVTVLGLEELVANPGGADAVALTFDDALESAAEWALPALVERRLPATIFVPTRHVGGDNRWQGVETAAVPILPVMTWDALGRAHESGMEIGAHTRTHPRLPDCSAEALEDELGGALEDVRSELGVMPHSLAYPYGLSTPRVRALAADRFRHGVTTELRAIGMDEDSLALPRLDAWYLRRAGLLEHWGSSLFRTYLGVRRGARGLRGLVRP